MSSLRQEEHGNAEAAVATKLHEHTCVEHRHRGRGTTVTDWRPCVEGEQGTKHTETNKHKREQHILNSYRDVVIVCNLENAHG